jgi:hypothetical protein
MDRPWFRRWAGFGRIPITWQGWAATAIAAAWSICFGSLFLKIDDTHPALEWACGILAISSAAAHFALTELKLERHYGE